VRENKRRSLSQTGHSLILPLNERISDRNLNSLHTQAQCWGENLALPRAALPLRLVEILATLKKML